LLKFFTFYFLLFIFFVGCGYKPSSHYAKNAISGKVYVDVSIDINNAQNSVLIKDAMNELVLNQFSAQLTDNQVKADTIVLVKLSSVSHKAISSDDEGYASTYRTTVGISVSYNKKDESKKTINVSNYYDYAVDPDSVSLTEQDKQIAIKLASTKALSDIFSKIAISTMKDIK